MISEKMEHVLKSLEQSNSSEGLGVAEILRDIGSNGNDDEEIDMSSDEFLLSCAEEIAAYATEVINAFLKK